MEKKQTKIKNDEFVITQIKETPFAILEDLIRNEIWILLGNEKITQYKTKDEAKKAVLQYNWDLLGPVIIKIARFEAQQAAINLNNNTNTNK